MTIMELREKRNKALDAAKAFLESHRTESGVLTASDDATYTKMEADIDALTNEIHRLERQEQREAEISKPINTPLTSKPSGSMTPEKKGRASDAYKEGMLTALRTNFRQVSNVLQEGVDADGGYLVPEEYDSRLIKVLNGENIMRKLGHKITTSGDHKINIASTEPAAAWIEEGGALQFSDAQFSQILLDAHKLHVAIKVTEELLYDSAYTDSNFNRHKNDGQLDQYYVADHHEAIISHEDFDAAAALIEQRANEKGIKRGSNKYQQRYAFSGKIICSECGDTFRRRIHTSTYVKYPAWVCNTHLTDTSKCSMLYLRDDDIKLAFATMINKLIYCHKLVLKPYLESLQANTSDKALLRIQQLETLLEQNAEQRETLHKLMAQGYIDQILFTQENNVLLTQANDFRSDIEALNRSQTLDTTKVYETERLIHFCERGEMLQKYNEELFELFVDHIEVYSRQSIGFVLHCGLTFKERI